MNYKDSGYDLLRGESMGESDGWDDPYFDDDDEQNEEERMMSSRYHTKRQHKKRPKKGLKPATKPKAFKSEANAKSWAESHGMKGYRIEQITKAKFKLRKKA